MYQLKLLVGLGVNYIVIGKKDMVIKKEKWDGRSRPTNKAYDESWNRIFGEKEEEELKESLKQSRLNRKEHSDKEK